MIAFKESESNELFVTDKPQYITLDQLCGEVDLIKIALGDHRETCWVYSHDDSTWYSLTKKFKKHEKNNKILVNIIYLFDLAEIGKKVTHYHTHPKIAFDINLDYYLTNENKFLVYRNKDTKKVKETDRGTRETLIKLFLILGHILPSKEDMDSFIKYINISNEVVLDFKITHMCGLTQINLNKNKISSYKKILKYYNTKSQEIIANSIESWTYDTSENPINNTLENMSEFFEGDVFSFQSADEIMRQYNELY